MKKNAISFILHSQKFRKVIRRYKVKKIAVFGSYIHNEAKKFNDIDFLVVFQKNADLLDQVGLKLDLEALIKQKVDVVTPNSLSKHFRQKVMTEAVYL